LASLRSVPILGELLSNLSLISLAAILVVVAIYVLLNRTAFGMHVIASGKSPVAASTVGINVSRVQYQSVSIGGFCNGLAGAFLSISFMDSFVKNMVAGRGFIAIATILFGRYNPVLVALAGLLFGFLDALQIALQGTVEIPSEIIQSIPYLVTIVAVALSGKSGQPKRMKKRKEPING
jgi:ABC-type uncharacterized transport system permease subunit